MPTQLLGFNIVRLAHLKRNRDDVVFKAQIGVGLNQVGLLLLLNEYPGVGAAQLARALLIKPQSIAPLLSELERLGLVKKDGERRRGARIKVHLTRAGKGLLIRAQRLVLRTEQEVRQGLSREEASKFNQTLIRIADYYADLVKSEPAWRVGKFTKVRAIG